jgi:hypothetical protein
MRSFKHHPRILGLMAALLAVTTAGHRHACAQTNLEPLVRTFAAARAWLDAGGAGAAIEAPAEVRSAAVVLRLHGRVIGMGKDAGGPAPQRTVDRALRAAFDDARAKAPSRPAAPADPAELGRSLTLELELAGDRVPLIGRTFEEASRQFEPGECGLQLADGDRTAYMPASFLLARDMAAPASRGIVSLVRELGLPARDLPELQELGGRTALYSSKGLRITERSPGGALVVPCRLLPAVPGEAPPREWMHDACGRIAGRLERQLEFAPGGDGAPQDAVAQLGRTGLRGDFRLLAGSFEPFTAPPGEQALAAWALARAATTPGWPQPLRDRCAATSRRVLTALADVDPSEREPTSDPIATACILLAAAELGGAGELPPAFGRRAREALAAQLMPAALAVARPLERAMLLDAAAATASGDAPPIGRERLEPEIGSALASAGAAELPAIAPFLFDALRRLHGDRWAGAMEARVRDAANAARTVLLATQLGEPGPGTGQGPVTLDDMPGAYPTAGSASGRAGAQSLRMQVFVAMLAGLPGMRADDRDREDRLSLGRANRFLGQLLAPKSIACCTASPDLAEGGILASPAEATQPVAAQAFAILALAESERALARLDAADAGTPGIPASAPGR